MANQRPEHDRLKNVTTIPQSVIDAGAMSVRIFAVLLTHEVMSEETIAEKANIKRKSVSPAMTLLRRTGWVEASGRRGELQWKRRTEQGEPQPDFQKRRDSTVVYHLKEAERHIKIAQEKAAKLNVLEKAFRNVDLAEYFDDGFTGEESDDAG